MKRVSRFRLSILTAAAASLLLSVAVGNAGASEGQARTYLTVDRTIFTTRDRRVPLAVKPFLCEESGFGTDGPKYQKWFVGTQFDVFEWFAARVYYARLDVMPTNAPSQGKHLAVAEMLFHVSRRGFRVLNRESDEWHASDNFHRYRNLTEVMYRVPDSAHGAFCFDEFRVDFDRSRINQNDIAGGVQLGLKPSLIVRLFYDLRATRRGHPDWRYIQFLGLSFAAHE